jgi:sterol desaturase/sphingolipid hydroxylase (fatty acid hydroxylase superfamily)
MMLGLNVWAFLIVVGGYSYLWLGLVLASALALAHLAERVSPVHEEWNHSHDDTKANVAHAVVYEISNINATLLLPVIAWLTPWDGFWPTHWPLAVQLIMAIVLADFGVTIIHWLSHRSPLLWRLHAVHHGVPRMYGFNGLVRHPLHQTLDLALATGPLAMAGMPVEVAALLGVAISIQLIVQHSNVDYALGPFRNHLSIGAIHHLHHVNWGEEGDCNYGLFLTVWDRMLGTFKPEPSRKIGAHDLGVDELPHFPRHSYWQQLLLPFVYEPGKGEPARYAHPDQERPGKLQPGE